MSIFWPHSTNWSPSVLCTGLFRKYFMSLRHVTEIFHLKLWPIGGFKQNIRSLNQSRTDSSSGHHESLCIHFMVIYPIVVDNTGRAKVIDQPTAKPVMSQNKAKQTNKTGRLSINILSILSLSIRGSQAECVAQIKGLISTLHTSYSVSSGSGLMGRLCRDSTGA